MNFHDGEQTGLTTVKEFLSDRSGWTFILDLAASSLSADEIGTMLGKLYKRKELDTAIGEVAITSDKREFNYAIVLLKIETPLIDPFVTSCLREVYRNGFKKREVIFMRKLLSAMYTEAPASKLTYPTVFVKLSRHQTTK
jgi:hypothetical protein